MKDDFKTRMYVIKGLKLCNYLINNGFVVQKVDRDINNRDYLIFFFENTQELRDYITKFSNNNKK